MLFQPLEIKNQGKTDFCLGCSISSAAEEIVGEPCEEAYSYAAGKKASKEPIEVSALKPKSALIGAIKYGVLPKKHSPYSIAKDDRNFLANFNNWKDLERFTVKPFKSFRKVRNIEKALQSSSLIVGLYWQGEWDDSPVIPFKSDFHKLEPHEVRAIGMKDEYLILQNSRGTGMGDNGLWYLPESMWKVIHHAYALSPKPWANTVEKLIAYYL